MSFVLFTKKTAVTGRAIRDAFGFRGSYKAPDKKENVLIRWGSSARVAKKPGRVLNSRNAIERATNKLLSLEIMRNNHVRVPDWLPYGHNTPIPTNFFPLLGRTTNHMGGTDIVFCLQRQDLNRAIAAGANIDFVTRYIPVAREFRVHVFNGEVLKISEKILSDETKFKFPWIRNFDNGYTFHNLKQIPNAVRQEVEDQGIRAVQALGLDFGAADVILGDDANGYVLEVNTGPSLSDASLNTYIAKFAEVLEIPEDTINWPEAEEVAEEELEELI